MVRVLSLFALALLVVTPSYADDKIDAKLLLGKWEPTGDKIPPGLKAVIEFQKDDKVVVEVDFQGKSQKIEGKYKVDGNKMEMTMKSPDGQERTQKLTIVKLTDKEATIKDDDKNEEQILKKLP
jgi:uncharacterized protein (TIGR03066 family)